MERGRNGCGEMEGVVGRGGGGAGEGHQDLTGHRVGVGGGRAGVSQTACKTPLPQNERIKSRFRRAYLSGKPIAYAVCL